ncbi:MAG: hypothetical protein JNL12_20850 [Planctomycetes bacterium]|nr:hypothetical protein [Planctomycetota bacterium]
MRVLLLAAFSLTPIVATRAQSTWIVHPSGGGSFTQIAAAYDAASPGDTLLVHPGNYQGFVRYQAKGVRILGLAAGVVVTSPIVLGNVPAGQQLALLHLTVDAANNPFDGPYPQFTALSVFNAPDVLLSDLVVRGPYMGSVCPCSGGTGVNLDNTTTVMSRVTAYGANGVGWTYGESGGPAVHALDSHLTLSACTLRAGNSGAGQLSSVQTSASLACLSSTVVVDECTIQNGSPLGNGIGAYLGSDVLIANHAGITQTVLRTTNGGAVQYQGAVLQGIGSPSFPLTARPQPGLIGPATAMRGGQIDWTVHGDANETFVFGISLGIVPTVMPGLFEGTVFTALHPTSALGFATTQPTGDAFLTLPVPNLPSLEGLQVFLQVGGWISQPIWKASGVAVTTIR